jgi:hypothetical protein
MVEEEKIILGGNVTALGVPSTVTAVTSATAGSLANSTTYHVRISALTLYGYLNGAIGHGTADSPDETGISADATGVTGGAATSLDCSWAAVRGAVAYNVFVGSTAGNVLYQFTTTATKCNVKTSGGAGNTFNAADQTADAVSFDGVIPQIQASANNGYFKDIAGLTLTADNVGGISEVDTMLQSLWDNSRIGPTVFLVNSQQAKDMTAKIAANGSSTVLRLNASIGSDGVIRGGLKIGSYLNKFTGQDVDILTHPYLAPGTILALSERLPYPNNNVPNPFELEVLREYTQYDWALASRKYEYGVYGTECLKVYFPAGCGSLVGIAAG